MLVGFGGYGTEPELAPPSQVTSMAIAQLGTQLTGEQQCGQSNGEVYCLSKQSHLDKQKYMHVGIGAAAGVVAGALVAYLVLQ